MVIRRQATTTATKTVRPTPGLPAIYVAHFADAVLGDPQQHEDLMRACGLDPGHIDPEKHIPLEQVLALVAAIDAQARPGWHIGPALSLEAAHHGPVGIAVGSAPTLGRALDALVRFEPLRFSVAALHCRLDDNFWRARVLPLIDPEGPWELLLEIHLLSLAGLLERLLGAHSRWLSLQMPALYRPWRSLLTTRLGSRLRFRGRHYELQLPADSLKLPSRLASADIHGDALARCEQLLGRQAETDSIAAQVRSRLLTAGSNLPGIEQMARELCCSSRTLTRRLGAAGTSYRQLVDNTRRVLAADLLRCSDHTISDIADQLGYRDPANFGRACRRWFGRSPGALQRGRD